MRKPPGQQNALVSLRGTLNRAGQTISTLRGSLDKPLVPKKRPFNAVTPLTGGPLTGGNLNKPNDVQAPRKKRLVNHETLMQLATQDPVTWGIIRMTRSIINQTPWDIVPDIDEELRELDRWQDQATDSINEWDYAIEFGSALLPDSLIGPVSAEIKDILKGTKDDNRAKRYRLETLFRIIKRELEQEAFVNAEQVRRIFKHPNNHWEKTLRALQELIIKDLLIDDAGVIIKNHNALGELAELYTVPGYQIIPFSYPDGTVPQPPLAAYAREDQSVVRGYYTNSQLTYIMENPQGDGYGMSPLEALIYVNTATVLGDNKFITMLREGDIPPAIINLKDASREQRETFEGLLHQQIAKSKGNRIITVSGVPSEDGEMQFIPIPRGMDFNRIQAMQYLQMAPGIKAFVFGFEHADIGLLMDGASGTASPEDVAGQLKDRRAITGRLSLLQEYYNGEIVKQEWPFQNVRFQFDYGKARIIDPLKQAQAHSVRIANGSMTRNESRKFYGERPIPGGDVPTITTGNALVQADALSPASADDMQDVLSAEALLQQQGQLPTGQPTAPTVAKVDPKKRNNATERQVMKGMRTTKSAEVTDDGATQ